MRLDRTPCAPSHRVHRCLPWLHEKRVAGIAVARRRSRRAGNTQTKLGAAPSWIGHGTGCRSPAVAEILLMAGDLREPHRGTARWEWPSALAKGNRVRRDLRERHAGTAPAVSMGRLAPRAVADATPATRDRYADFLRVASMLVVVLGHWLMTAVAWDGGQLAGTNVLALLPGLWLATWVFQVMPVFFVVGGFANLRAVDSIRRRGGGYVEFLTSRAARLLRPVVAFVAVWLALPPLLTLAGAPGEATRTIAKLLPQPLWFLATYLIVVAMAPPMARLHRRFGPRVLAALAVAA